MRRGDESFKESYPEAVDSYIAFEPTQIKSAVSNTGEFSETDPRITYALNEPETKPAARAPMKQRPITEGGRRVVSAIDRDDINDVSLQEAVDSGMVDPVEAKLIVPR